MINVSSSVTSSGALGIKDTSPITDALITKNTILVPRRPLVYFVCFYIFGIAFCYYYAPPFELLLVLLLVSTVCFILCLPSSGVGKASVSALLQGVGKSSSPLARPNQTQYPHPSKLDRDANISNRHCSVSPHTNSNNRYGSSVLLKLKPLLPFSLFMCMIFFAGAAYAHTAFSKQDPLEKEMANGQGYSEGIIGRVLSVEKRDEDYHMLTLSADDRKLLVRIYGKPSDDMALAAENLVGKRITLKGTLSIPDTARNPHCFDYRLFLLTKNIRVLVTCAPADINLIEDHPASFIQSIQEDFWKIPNMLVRVKAALSGYINAALDADDSALFMGMLFGDTNEMDEETYDLFKRNGVAHILSVSGLHVGMVYAFASMALGRKKTKRFYIAALILLLIYAALANFSPPVMRAFSMITLHIFSKLLHRRYDMLTGVLCSAFIMLIFNPLSIFGTGFILSYLAVTSLAFSLPFIDRFTGFRNRLSGSSAKDQELKTIYGAPVPALLAGAVLKLLLPLAAIQLFVLPVTAYFFNCIPLTAIFANIPVVAISSVIVPFGIVCMIVTAAGMAIPAYEQMLGLIAEIGASAAGVMIDMMLFFTQLADSVPGGSLTVASPPLPLILLFYGAAFFLLSDTFAMSSFCNHMKSEAGKIKHTDFSCPALIILACLLVFSSPINYRNDASFTFVDVRQGDCLHIRTEDGRNYLMDGGGKYDYNIGKNLLAPYLLKNGVDKLDGIFVSHLHMDHFKGLIELAAVLDIGFVYVYDGNRVQPEAVTHAFSESSEAYEDRVADAVTVPEGVGSVQATSDDTSGTIPSSGAFPESSLRYLKAGDAVLLGDHARADVLFPPAQTYEEYLRKVIQNYDENLTSLIIRFEIDGVSVLMTGDVAQEGELQAMSVADLSCDILKVGHHGSKTSTSKSLLDASTPSAAIIQVGKNNYGHPAPETLETLAEAGLPVYRNDQDGAVLIRSLTSEGTFEVRTMKRDLLSPMLLKDYERTTSIDMVS